MNRVRLKRSAVFGVLLAVLIMAFGCGRQVGGDGSKPVSESPLEVAAETDGHDYGGWWCNAHGVPEEECSMCSSKAADAFKTKGDWCEDHNRAESQCFICDPSRADKFAKLYEAKVGHQPPAREE